MDTGKSGGDAVGVTPARLEIGETVTVNGREFVATEVIHEDDAVRVVDLKPTDEQ